MNMLIIHDDLLNDFHTKRGEGGLRERPISVSFRRSAWARTRFASNDLLMPQDRGPGLRGDQGPKLKQPENFPVILAPSISHPLGTVTA